MALLPAYEYTPEGGPTRVINFIGPLAEDPNFSRRVSARDVFSGKGIRQRNTDFKEQRTELVHEWATRDEMLAVDKMMDLHVIEGGTFKFIPDQGVPGVFFEVELLDKEFDPDRQELTVDRWKWALAVRVAITK